MDARSEKDSDILISRGNTGNTGNEAGKPLSHLACGDMGLFPNAQTPFGNSGDSTKGTIVLPVPSNAPAVPKWALNLKIDGKQRPATAQWDYRDAQGCLLFHVMRFDVGEGRKEFRPLSLWHTEKGLAWKRKAPPEPRPLYGLDRLTANPGAVVIVCEGEKSADAAAKLFPDHVTIASMNGAQSPEKSDWTPLAGRTLTLWGDRDPAGEAYIASVERLATEAGAKVLSAIRAEWFLQMSAELGVGRREALPQGWDAADALAEGFTAENIAAFLDGEKALHGDNLLFSRTPSQHAEVAELIAQRKLDRLNVEAEAEEKRAQTLGLFKESEFAVIEFRKGLRNGVFWQEPFGEEDTPKTPLWLCSPLIVLAETRDTVQSNWGRLLSWRDNDGHLHTWACPVEFVQSQDTAEFRRELARGGLLIATNGKARQKLVDYVLTYPPQSEERIRCVDKIGWHGERYVLDTRVFGKAGAEGVIYQGATSADFSIAGDLDAWKQEVASLAVGNSRILFAISCSFAGTLVEMAHESGGGFQFTGATSRGKTSTIVDPAASVWGHPDRFAKKWRTTANGLEALCLSRNHAILILDDLGQSEARECGQAAYLIANGQGKARMLREGGNRPLSTWRTMLLSCGEVDISQHMAEAGQTVRGGQVVRLPSIPADAGVGMYVLERLHNQPDGRHFSDAMKTVTRQCYGCAGVTFLEKLTENVGEVSAEIHGAITELVRAMKIPDGTAPEVGRVAARFALVAYAGELATRYGATGWPQGEATRAALRCFDDWFKESGGSLGVDEKVLFAQVSAFLQAHGASRFPPHDISEEDLRRVLNRAGFSYSDGERLFFLAESGTFRKELCKGFNLTVATKALIKAGWLVPGAERTQQKKRINAINSKAALWFYVLTDDALGGDV